MQIIRLIFRWIYLGQGTNKIPPHKSYHKFIEYIFWFFEISMLFQVHDNAPIRHHSTLIRSGFPAVPQHRGTYNTALSRPGPMGCPRSNGCHRPGASLLKVWCQHSKRDTPGNVANLRIESSVRTPSPRFRTKSLALAAKTSVMHWFYGHKRPPLRNTVAEHDMWKLSSMHGGNLCIVAVALAIELAMNLCNTATINVAHDHHPRGKSRC